MSRWIHNKFRERCETGFVVSAISFTADEYRGCGAFNTLRIAWVANAELTGWLTIKCPEPVIIWRIAFTAMSTLDSWCLSASNDGSVYIDLLRSNDRLVFNYQVDSVPKFFVLPSSATTAYQYYKIDITNVLGGPVGISYMQLYVYDT